MLKITFVTIVMVAFEVIGANRVTVVIVILVLVVVMIVLIMTML